MRTVKLLGKFSLLAMTVALAVACAEKAATGMEAKANAVVDELAAGDFDSVVAKFDSTMKLALSEPQLRQTWASVTEQAGSFKNRTTPRVAQEMGYTSVYVPCEFERATLTAKVVYNDDGQISGFFLQ